MKALREYLRALAAVAAVYAATALVMEIPPVGAGFKWALHGVFDLACEYRWATVATTALVMAGFLAVAEKGGPERGPDVAAGGR